MLAQSSYMLAIIRSASLKASWKPPHSARELNSVKVKRLEKFSFFGWKKINHSKISQNTTHLFRSSVICWGDINGSKTFLGCFLFEKRVENEPWLFLSQYLPTYNDGRVEHEQVSEERHWLSCMVTFELALMTNEMKMSSWIAFLETRSQIMQIPL